MKCSVHSDVDLIPDDACHGASTFAVCPLCSLYADAKKKRIADLEKCLTILTRMKVPEAILGQIRELVDAEKATDSQSAVQERE